MDSQRDPVGALGKDEESDQSRLRALSNFQRLSYGVGHVLNDLTASMWFSYLLIFFHQVRHFSNELSGNLMLIGQVSDALFTPFIGYESDITHGVLGIGKRKTWHLLGTFLVMVSFPFLFSACIRCGNAPDWSQFIYYVPFVVIFQFGWAAVQISHLSFSSDLTPYAHERATLQSVRNFFTVFANMSVYGIFYLLFEFSQKHNYINVAETLSTDDTETFRNLTLICLGMGTVFNLLFHLGTKEMSHGHKELEHSSEVRISVTGRSTGRRKRMNWKDWLKEHQFYQIALVYMCTRLYINISQVYFPMYLIQTVNLDKKSIALLPLSTYGSSFLMSFAAAFLNKYNRKMSYMIGLVLGAASCIWLYFVPEYSNQVYGCAFFMGASNSLLLITSLSMTNDLINHNVESGAFVFGAMSFTDKLSNGVAVIIIQNLHPCPLPCPVYGPFYRLVQSSVPGGALCVAFVVFLTILPQKIGIRGTSALVKRNIEGAGNGRIEPEDDTSRNIHCTCAMVGPLYPACAFCTSSLLGSDGDGIGNHTNAQQASGGRDIDREREPLLAKNVGTSNQDVSWYTQE